MTRVLLCRPVGGLNDILCEIETCWRYAEAHGRILIVDTLNSGLVDHFGRYFERRSPEANVLLHTSSELIARLARLTILPAAMTGRLTAYDIRWQGSDCLDAATGTRLSFDFSVDHDSAVLLHQQSAGSLLSLDCLSRLRLTDDAAREVSARLAGRPASYVAIQVRNTDMKTNYRRLFRRLRREVAGRDLLICSDDFACIAFARRTFTKSRVFTVSDIPDTGGVRLHRNKTLDRRKTNIDALVDLIAMAGAETLHFNRNALWNRLFGRFRPRPVSGYAKLAEALGNRPDLVEGLLFHVRPRQGG